MRRVHLPTGYSDRTSDPDHPTYRAAKSAGMGSGGGENKLVGAAVECVRPIVLLRPAIGPILESPWKRFSTIPVRPPAAGASRFWWSWRWRSRSASGSGRRRRCCENRPARRVRFGRSPRRSFGMPPNRLRRSRSARHGFLQVSLPGSRFGRRARPLPVRMCSRALR